MARREAWSAGALALVALFALVESARLDIGSVTRPGPGFFPLVLAAALALAGAALLVRAWRAGGRDPAARDTASGEPGDPSSAEPGDGPGQRAEPRKLLATLAALAIYIAAFERLGFLLATVALLTFLVGALARYRWPLALGTAVAMALAAYVVFDTWLQVRLPPGILGRW